MQKKAFLISVFLMFCLVLFLSAASQDLQTQKRVQEQKFDTEMIELRAKIKELEKELDLMQSIIKIRGQNVDINTRGDIRMRATSISVEALAKAEMKGNQVNVQASSTNTISGALVKIN